MKTLYKINRRVQSLTGTRKRSFGLSEAYGPEQHTASYWDGGSKSEYTVINRQTGASFTPPCGTYKAGFRDGTYTLKPGEILLSSGTFCGKQATPRFTCLPGELAETKAFLGIGPDEQPVE